MRELRKQARKDGKELLIAKNQGKGSHYRVTYGGRTTTLKGGELSPNYMKLVRKQLGV